MNDKHSSIYLMHKYWGKKPGDEIKNIIEKYSTENDVILDPFCGYGGLAIEGILSGRNVIINDLNPIANFINMCILEQNINLDKFISIFNSIKKIYEDFKIKWYTYNGYEIISILRNSKNVPLRIRVKNADNKLEEHIFTEDEIKQFVSEEDNYTIPHWYPNTILIDNSRIGAKNSMSISDLFPKRALICNSFLFNIINKLEDSAEKNLLLFTFTANIANCSKLVPPIKSRGEMSQGAWMTGFYIGETYIENNVFHYFENRIKKTINGKKSYLNSCKSCNNLGKYKITNQDAKNLELDNLSIDFVFTDFPYGDTVPYFEQSQLWNSWLGLSVDYENEIVISDSNSRQKKIDNFTQDIAVAISEISRVLKDGRYLVFTFHSLYGNEWSAIVNALKNNNFKFVECKSLIQKTFSPRQLNRKNTIKGDMIVIYQKVSSLETEIKSNFNFEIHELIMSSCEYEKLYETNELIELCVKVLLSTNCAFENMDFFDVINMYFVSENDKWRLKDELR